MFVELSQEAHWPAAGEEYWHGATDSTRVAHIAMVVGDESGDGTTWPEPVTDDQYTAALAAIGH